MQTGRFEFAALRHAARPIRPGTPRTCPRARLGAFWGAILAEREASEPGGGGWARNWSF